MDYYPFKKRIDDNGRASLILRPDSSGGLIKKLRTRHSIVEFKRLITVKDGIKQGLDIIEADWHIEDEGLLKNLWRRFCGIGTIVFTASGRKEQRWEKVPKPKKIGAIFDELRNQLKNPPELADRLVVFDGLPEVLKDALRKKCPGKNFMVQAVGKGEFVSHRSPIIIFGKRRPGTIQAAQAGAIMAPLTGIVEEIIDDTFKIRPRKKDESVIEENGYFTFSSYFMYELMDMVQLHPELLREFEGLRIRIEKTTGPNKSEQSNR